MTVSGEARTVSCPSTSARLLGDRRYRLLGDPRMEIVSAAQFYPTERGEDGLVTALRRAAEGRPQSIGGGPSTIYLHVWDWPVNGGGSPGQLSRRSP